MDDPKNWPYKPTKTELEMMHNPPEKAVSKKSDILD